MDKNIFSARLKEARKQKQMTMQDLAERAELSKSAISLYESGEREPLLNTAIKIAKVLNVPIAYLIGEEISEDAKRSYLDHVSAKYGLDSIFTDLVDLDEIELLRLEEDIEIALRVIKEKHKL